MSMLWAFREQRSSKRRRKKLRCPTIYVARMLFVKLSWRTNCWIERIFQLITAWLKTISKQPNRFVTSLCVYDLTLCLFNDQSSKISGSLPIICHVPTSSKKTYSRVIVCFQQTKKKTLIEWTIFSKMPGKGWELSKLFKSCIIFKQNQTLYIFAPSHEKTKQESLNKPLR